MTDEAFLLAGGKGKRLGRDKRFIPLKGIPLYLRQLHKLQAAFSRVTLLCKEGEEILFDDGDVPIITEEDPESSLLCGLITGLRHAAGDHVFFLSVDLPFLPGEALEFFRDYPVSEKPVLPKSEGRFHAGCSLFPREALPRLTTWKKQELFTLHHLLPELDPIFLEGKDLPFLRAHPHAFFNLNTPPDLERLQEIIADLF